MAKLRAHGPPSIASAAMVITAKKLAHARDFPTLMLGEPRSAVRVGVFIVGRVPRPCLKPMPGIASLGLAATYVAKSSDVLLEKPTF